MAPIPLSSSSEKAGQLESWLLQLLSQPWESWLVTQLVLADVAPDVVPKIIYITPQISTINWKKCQWGRYWIKLAVTIKSWPPWQLGVVSGCSPMPHNGTKLQVKSSCVPTDSVKNRQTRDLAPKAKILHCPATTMHYRISGGWHFSLGWHIPGRVWLWSRNSVFMYMVHKEHIQTPGRLSPKTAMKF